MSENRKINGTPIDEDLVVFKYKVRKHPKVILKKLGREKFWGTYDNNGYIEIDPRLKGLRELIIYTHEYFHFLFPELNEDEIIATSEQYIDFIWKLGYRKVDNEDK